MSTISYSLLGQAIELYERRGYRQVEVPWRVTADILNITKPAGSQNKDYIIQGTDKGLIASGEQGFLYLANKGVLPPGKYQTVTPCFRNETHDRYHSKQFMKLELIEILTDEETTELVAARLLQEKVNAIVEDAKAVMQQLADVKARHLFIAINADNFDDIAVQGTQQRDIVITLDREIELGSYGARRTSFGAWIYGTGLAEPRFSKAMSEARMQMMEQFTGE